MLTCSATVCLVHFEFCGANLAYPSTVDLLQVSATFRGWASPRRPPPDTHLTALLSTWRSSSSSPYLLKSIPVCSIRSQSSKHLKCSSIRIGFGARAGAQCGHNVSQSQQRQRNKSFKARIGHRWERLLQGIKIVSKSCLPILRRGRELLHGTRIADNPSILRPPLLRSSQE